MKRMTQDQTKVNPREEKSEPQYFCLKAAICGVWVPSVVGDRKKMFIVSASVGLVSKVLLVGLAVGIGLSGDQHLVHRDPFLIWCQQLEAIQARVTTTEKNLEMCSFKTSSLSRFFEFGSTDKTLNEDTEENAKWANNETAINELQNEGNTSKGREIPTEEIESSGNKIINNGNFTDEETPHSTDEHISFPESSANQNESKSQAHLIQRIRICGSYEEEHVISLIVSALLLLSTLASFVSSWMLFKISDYEHLYKISKTWLWVFKTEPVIHRSLLFSTVTDIALEKLLQRGEMQKYVNRPNYQGQFALHLAAERKDAKCTLLLMEAGGKAARERGRPRKVDGHN